MADYLASIFGTEKDKVNCSFYFKIGACRHGDRCSRQHNKPTFSQTILLPNLYLNPANIAEIQNDPNWNDDVLQKHFDDFYADIFIELNNKYGNVEDMNVCDNLGDHLVGNVYVKFQKEEDAEQAVQDLNNRYYDSRAIYAELSPVTDFREACCRQYESGDCTRGGFCNFMHLKPISRELRKELFGNRHRESSPSRDHERRRPRSSSPPYSRKRSYHDSDNYRDSHFRDHGRGYHPRENYRASTDRDYHRDYHRDSLRSRGRDREER